MSSPVKEEQDEYAEYASRLKDQGNEAFKQGDIPLSIKYYTEAIDMDPDNHVYYSNRSAGMSYIESPYEFPFVHSKSIVMIKCIVVHFSIHEG